MSEKTDKEKRLPRWYFGGLASAGAACCTHPLDLIKVHLQTQQEGKTSIINLTRNIIKKQGFLALYSGLSASLCRQLTYSTTRFGIYEVAKQNVRSDSFYTKVIMAAVAGAAGGFVGTPADMVNVRMQNDIKLPPEKRRNYKHAIDGLIRVYRDEGMRKLFSGASTATSRAVLMTIGQLSFYDQVKMLLLHSGMFRDNVTTHFLSSLTAACAMTVMTQPIDVLKTRMMSAKEGEFKSLWSCIVYTKNEGILAFYKGILPSAIRIVPGNVLTFFFYEQLRQYFGKIAEACVSTVMTQPIDVLKTRMMNDKDGQYKSLVDCILHTQREGFLAFFKGILPSFIRILPMNIIVFLLYEQLRQNFGFLPKDK